MKAYKLPLILVCVLPFILDLVYGYFLSINIDLPISSSYRTLVLVVSLGIILSYPDRLTSQFVLISIAIFLFSIVFWDISNLGEFSREIKIYSKWIYTLALISFYMRMAMENPYYCFKLFSLSAFFISSMIIMSYFTELGISTYGEYSFGVKSYFDAINDTGLALLLLLQLQFYKLFRENNILDVFVLLLVSSALVMLGSRAGIIGLIGIYLSNLLYFVVFSEYSKMIKLIFGCTFLLCLVQFVSEYFEYISDYQYMIEKFLDMSNLSPRYLLITSAKIEIGSFSLASHLIGNGSVDFSRAVDLNYLSKDNSLYGKFVEQDFFDMYGSYGLLQTLLMYSVPVIVMIRCAYLFIKFRYKYIHFNFLVLIFLYLLNSILAGHALSSTIVAPIVSFIYSLIIYEWLYAKSK
ncbi:hypothetical protein D0812_24295 [Vibrio owensii]|uniref:Uncharacterized protein n=1 Tax=Vibrio owensii TaxID=696485 RepID=A0AAP9KCL8_9VIBR|nr:O-antigen ligase family protein [Vibrio owensii]AYO17488.1 hypothetical protein D0812_24295 [Vibrio owensii]QGH49630.1 hypothetical protein APZ19_21285 [Vibrio owensii]